MPSPNMSQEARAMNIALTEWYYGEEFDPRTDYDYDIDDGMYAVDDEEITKTRDTVSDFKEEWPYYENAQTSLGNVHIFGLDEHHLMVAVMDHDEWRVCYKGIQ